MILKIAKEKKIKILDEDFDGETFDADQDEQIFEFVEVPSFVTLFTGITAEPLYFVQLKENRISEKKLSDAYGHVIFPGEKYFKGYYQKFICSGSISFKELEIMPMSIVLSLVSR